MSFQLSLALLNSAHFILSSQLKPSWLGGFDRSNASDGALDGHSELGE